MKKTKFIMLFAGIIISLTVTDALARVRVILRPYWPRAVIVAPRPRPRPPAPVRVPPPPPVRAPAPAPAPAETGFVNMNVQPSDAHVYVDGNYRGMAYQFTCAPDCLPMLEGRHALMLQKEGYRSESFDIQVVPHQIIDLDVRLAMADETGADAEPESVYQLELDKTGYLMLQVAPGDASVYIDGNFYGIASQFNETEGALMLQAGVHQIEIVKPGFQPYTRQITISEGEDSRIDVTLTR